MPAKSSSFPATDLPPPRTTTRDPNDPTPQRRDAATTTTPNTTRRPGGNPGIGIGALGGKAGMGLEPTGPDQGEDAMRVAMMHQGIPNETEQPARHHAGNAGDACAQGHEIP